MHHSVQRKMKIKVVFVCVFYRRERKHFYLAFWFSTLTHIHAVQLSKRRYLAILVGDVASGLLCFSCSVLNHPLNLTS